MQLVQGACYTDPADQSAWLYLRWIVSNATPATVCVCAALQAGETSSTSKGLVLAFSCAVRGVGGMGVTVQGCGEGQQLKHIAGRYDCNCHTPRQMFRSFVTVPIFLRMIVGGNQVVTQRFCWGAGTGGYMIGRSIC